MLKVYLGGPMTGLTVEEASHWRTDLMDRFVPGTIKWLNPVDQVDLDWNQTITTDYVDYGTKISSLQYPDAPTVTGYTFSGWDPAQNSGGTVISNITIAATYNGA